MMQPNDPSPAATPPQAPNWIASTGIPGRVRRDSVSGEFFKNTRFESVVREAIQNSLDARPKGSKNPATVILFWSGDEAAVPGADYARFFRGDPIDRHYSHPKSGLANIPSATENCTFLAIEDFQTTGLTGDVTRCLTDDELAADRLKGNYYNFFFRENGSNKIGDGALGSWGAGKIVFMKASRLRTVFVLSVRDDPAAPRFFAGRSVMKSHSIGKEIFLPDYWFGVGDPTADPTQLQLDQLPVTDSATIDAFAKLFRLQRRADQPGTSIVVPYPELSDGDDRFSPDDLVTAVVKNFLLAIQDGELEVMMERGGSKDIRMVTKGTLADARRSLPASPDPKKALVTCGHFDLAAEAFAPDFPAERTVVLRCPGTDERPQWDDARFDGIDLKAVKKTLNAGKALLFRVPLEVLGKQRGNHGPDSFSVALRKAPSSDPYRTAFYRRGLLIDDASRKAFPGCVSVVRVEKGPLSDLLVASEPPSHSSWESRAERVCKDYRYPGVHIDFVTRAVGEILSRIEAADQEPDFDVLSGPFGIPVEEKPSQTPPPPGPPPEPKPPTPPGPDDPPENTIPEEFVHLNALQSKVGFTISMREGRVSEKGYPVRCPFLMGYAPFTKSSWSPFDFRLDGPGAVSIELGDPAQADIVEIVPKDNLLTLVVKKPGAFQVHVTGFDPNRDLEVSKKRYVYPDPAAPDASPAPAAPAGGEV